jgi:para-nitrobenzyl esterase
MVAAEDSSMQISSHRVVGTAMMVAAMAVGTGGRASAQVKLTNGFVEGTTDPATKVRAFKGIPYAAPPVGDLRWKAPQAPIPWSGVRKADAFGPRCMQGSIFDDMVFRDEMSEDCLVLNVWTPAARATAKLPVMVWIHGGGFQAGSGSEPRQDGAKLAAKGVVVVSLNYRMGVFGFFAHPELTKESTYGASGNYGLMDQVAALQWVKANAAAFGGDPGNVTIFGESAGSLSVCALMASPLARGLFHKAIGESGAYFGGNRGPLPLKSLADSEKAGAEFGAGAGASTLADLRAKPADDLLKAALAGGSAARWFAPILDGHVLPRDVPTIFADGQQAKVPLLAGWNRDESRASVTLNPKKPTAESFAAQVRSQFGAAADAVLKAYPAATDAEALEAAATLASDLFMGYGTWCWIEAHLKTGGAPVYRYSFDQPPPIPAGTKTPQGVEMTAKDVGARHAGEIEYVFGALDPPVPWAAEDRAISEAMMTYWSNFARTGDPNGGTLTAWPRYDAATGYKVLHIAPAISAKPDGVRERYETLGRIIK